MQRTKKSIDIDRLIPAPGSCFICKLLAGTHGYEHTVIHETDNAIAFLNKFPTLFGYALVAPKAHLEQVTGSFSVEEYLELQEFIYRVSEAIQLVLKPERLYVLSLGSQAANSHVHWHLAPLPFGVPLEDQQFNALMHENGVIDTDEEELNTYARKLRETLSNTN